LEDPSLYIRKSAVLALAELGEEAKVALPLLLKTLEEESLELRFAAMVAVTAITENMDWWNQNFPQIARHPLSEVRRKIPSLLVFLGPKAFDFIVPFLQDECSKVAEEAFLALKKISWPEALSLQQGKILSEYLSNLPMGKKRDFLEFLNEKKEFVSYLSPKILDLDEMDTLEKHLWERLFYGMETKREDFLNRLENAPQGKKAPWIRILSTLEPHPTLISSFLSLAESPSLSDSFWAKVGLLLWHKADLAGIAWKDASFMEVYQKAVEIGLKYLERVELRLYWLERNGEVEEFSYLEMLLEAKTPLWPYFAFQAIQKNQKRITKCLRFLFHLSDEQILPWLEWAEKRRIYPTNVNEVLRMINRKKNPSIALILCRMMAKGLKYKKEDSHEYFNVNGTYFFWDFWRRFILNYEKEDFEKIRSYASTSLYSLQPLVRQSAILALLELGPMGAPSLCQWQQDEDGPTLELMVQSICKLRNCHPSAMKWLINRLSDLSSSYKKLILECLSQEDVLPLDLRNVLAEISLDSHDEVRRLSAHLLGKLPPSPQVVMPLKNCLYDEKPEVRLESLISLLKVGYKIPEGTLAFLEHFSHPEDYSLCLKAIQNFPIFSSQILEKVKALASSSSEEIALAAIQALVRMGEVYPHPIVSFFLNFPETASPRVKEAVQQGIQKLRHPN
ncbi:MAG: hypothetical protein D6785_10140, partial [Planctomycetota bacterium]